MAHYKRQFQLYTILLLVAFSTLLPASGNSQDIIETKHRLVLFPYPMESKWRSSIGINITTMSEDITEEFRFRLPALDYHVNRKITNNFYLDGHVSAQLFQNMITIGPRWSAALNDRLSFSVGNDIGWWFGFINVEGFKTRGSGWQNYPNASAGLRFKKDLFLSLKAEAIMNLGVQTHTGEITVKSDDRLLSGGSVTIALEQPFYKKRSLTLGFRAIYTNFFWQTWALFENFDRNIFYPQIIIGLIL
jgi:hypothetical protein